MNRSIKPTASATETVEQRYILENELMHLAALGDADGIRKLHEKISGLYDFTRRSKDQMRNYKNALIVLNTLYRKGIEFGGVHPLHIHKISERFAIEIERSRTPENLAKIRGEMIDAYCNLSRLRSGSGYSLAVSRCVEYIKLKYSQRIGSTELAALVHVSLSYLCRRFKKETGSTIIEFINRARIEEAKRLLHAELRPISAIAADVGFESEAYFGRIFRKYVGVPPTSYRDSKPR